MRKLFVIALSGLMITGMISCKKEYTCNCSTITSYSSSDPTLLPPLPNETSVERIPFEAKKKDADSKCKEMEIDHGQPIIITTDSIPTGFDANFNIIWQSVTQTITITDACTV
ncbi:MAG: hypothetical protein K0U33_05500 [Bacteroidetes bacterium]|nr:hypothetical protein [Bacteroidota bacterium]